MPTENSQVTPRLNGFGKVRLLVVDGNVELTRHVSAHLAHLGFSVETAHNGRECLGLFRACKFPVVLAYLRSPNINGAEPLRKIKRTNPNVAVLLTVSPDENGSAAMPAADDEPSDIVAKTLRP